MKAILTALALVALMSAPTFAQPRDTNPSPSSPNYGYNGD
jgi:hypothetical protein